ncbi:NAD(P)H-dependent oxidoreductase [Pseudogulbenkiania subflava]|uniref:Putative NADPH-quinone reductase (Modulator of drug activity B) n=1 Tax=Pseudogulbenkiania subflava DSM 22618 TaxID=1123014 RepID=A0A1Y6BJW6_9NEIS|nr:NAD(P)H-dependent oxidoreductase [Pseudogulbenkiania subflava]SMF07537.1 Putative NADPH-quinone reductase (modulator of drug activity B) [Pseudogulbenkiania subflava DSM 22618]
MSKRILVIQGHPDPAGGHFCHALAEAYVQGGREAGHEVRLVEVATLDFPLLRSKEEFDNGTPVEAIRQAQESIAGAGHVVIVYPLWLGTMPALLKAFLEQVFRPQFAFDLSNGKGWHKRLSGKSARIVVTMGMPALIYRWYFGAHGLKSLKRSILSFSGIGPIRDSLIGMVEAEDGEQRGRWLETMRRLGREGR